MSCTTTGEIQDRHGAERRSRSRRQWFLPLEHGSWSLALEPVVLGLIAAAGVGAAALAVATLGAFLARRPLTVAWRGGVDAAAARRAAVLYVTLAAVGFAAAIALAPARALAGLFLAVPPGCAFLFLDARRETRAAAAEIAGAITFTVVPAVMALIDGWPTELAAALALTAAARSVPVLVTIRAFLRGRRGDERGRMPALVLGGIALTGVGALALIGLAPWLVVVLTIVQLVRSAWMLGPWSPRWSARRLGAIEAIVGALHVVLAGAAWAMLRAGV